MLAFCRTVTSRHAGGLHEAEDAAQEAALRAWRYHDRCRDHSDPRPWMAAIARREALRISTHRRTDHEVLISEVPDRAEDCERLTHVEERAALKVAIGVLRPADRLVLWLRYGCDLTQPAIAEALAIPEGTVKIRLHRARSRLRDAL